MQNHPEIRKGLAGVTVDYTAVSQVNTQTNSLLYRGYPVQELAGHVPFEQVAYLLWHGDLPDPQELESMITVERQHRALSPTIRQVIDQFPVTAHPMDVLRTAVSILGVQDCESESPDCADTMDRALRLFAAVPAIVAYDQRRRHGLGPIPPRDDLGYSANFLWMVQGSQPHPLEVEVFDTSMTLYAEHSFNASTFAARVATSTLTDYHSAITAGICTLKGPLHGGANEAVMHMFAEISSAERAVSWLDDALAARRKIMGFGHRVYKHGDSRVPTMKAGLDTLIAHTGRHDIAQLYQALADAMNERKGIQPNLDYPSGPAYHLLGFDTPSFTPVFVASRITGWTAHIIEQRQDNSLIRPLSAYNGKPERHLDAT